MASRRPSADQVRGYFWEMFAGSPVVETLAEREVSENFTSYASHEFRSAHQFILEHLLVETDAGRARRTLVLLRRCSGGYPYALSQILVRYQSQGQATVSASELYRELGAIVALPDAAAWGLLLEGARSGDLETRLSAILAMSQAFVRKEGYNRVNGSRSRPFPAEVDDLVEALPEDLRPQAHLALLSHLTVGEGISAVFAGEIARSERAILAYETRVVPVSAMPASRERLERALTSRDFAAVCFVLGEKLTSAGRADLAASFYALPLGPMIDPLWNEPSFIANSALCALRLGRAQDAVHRIESVVTMRPDMPNMQILRLKIWMEVQPLKAKQIFDTITADYSLSGADKDEMDRLGELIKRS